MERIGESVPKTDDSSQLAQHLGTDLDVETSAFVAKLSQYGIECLYPRGAYTVTQVILPSEAQAIMSQTNKYVNCLLKLA